MQVTHYAGDIWQDGAIHPALWRLLVQADLLVEIASRTPLGGAPSEIVLGVPHHAAPGQEQIAERWQNPRTGELGRPADESSALPGLALYQALHDLGQPARLVIACHATDHDPNKTTESAYWRSITAGPLPWLLFELHGAASRRRHDLELSAGVNPHTEPMRYGYLLGYHAPDWLLAVQRLPGSADAVIYKKHLQTGGKLQNPALRTDSLAEAGRLGFPALHLEMKFPFRVPDGAFPHDPRPNPTTWALARALAATLDAVHPTTRIHISAAEIGLPSSAVLVRPSPDYEESFWQALQEAPLAEVQQNSDLRIFSRPGARVLIEDYASVLYHGLPNDPPEECLWLIDQGEMVGRVIFFHWLNAYHRSVDGQVDYWIRPSRRRQGYGHLILRLVLERFRQLGLQRVLISCLAGNLPSRRIIEAAGGVFEGEINEQGDFRRRYWIEIPPR